MKIVVTSPSFSKNNVLKEELLKSFTKTKFNDEGVKFTKRELINFIKDADGIIVGLENIDRDVLKACNNLKIISKYGVGLNNIDLECCEELNIKIGWRGGINRLSVAEMTLGYMLMLSRNLFVSSNQLKKGIWDKQGGFELSGKTIGIVGVGNIGKEVIRLLAPFNCMIFVNDIIRQEEYYLANNVEETSKERIFKECDLISIHTPLDDKTENLVTIKEFDKMKSTAYIINSARGGIINEDDLKIALKKNIIAGAAVDAYIEEPPNDKELLALDNLICTPHIGGNSKEAILAMGKSAIENIKDLLYK